MSTVFVTGGSGFLGRHLIAALRARGDAVHALARSDAAAAAVSALGAEVVRGDLDNVAAMTAGMRGCACVLHAAALTQEWGPPALFERTTVIGTANVLSAAKSAGVPRLVHVGSEAALVDGSPMVRVDETRPLPTRPLPLYPASKAASEALVRSANGPELETVVVRPRLIWGEDDTSLLPQVIEAVRSGRFKWIGGGRYFTSSCHVSNAVEGLLLAAERGRPGGVYFLTDGAPVEFRSFMTRMLATQGVRIDAGSVPHALALAVAGASEFLWRALSLRGKPLVTRMAVRLLGEEVTVDDTKARRELGYRGAVSIEAGLAAMAAQARSSGDAA